MNDPVEHFFFVLFHRGWSEKQANETLTHYRSMLAAKQQAEADLAEANKKIKRLDDGAMATLSFLRAENETLVKHNKALMKIREDYDEHLRLCPQKSREKFKKAMEELEWYGEAVEKGFWFILKEDGGQRARAVIEGEENETRIQEEKKAEGPADGLEGETGKEKEDG